MVAGEFSEEIWTQKCRQMEVLEAVYPHPCAVPPRCNISRKKNILLVFSFAILAWFKLHFFERVGGTFLIALLISALIIYVFFLDFICYIYIHHVLPPLLCGYLLFAILFRT